MRRPLRPLLLFLLLLLPILPAEAASDSELVAQIDQLLAKTYPANEPGAAVLIEKGGKVLLRKGYGMANLELGVPIDPGMVFRLGSITKQFTAAAVLKLVEQGKLSLDDELTKFFPDYPTHGQRITVEHLLTHTSGIKSYTELDAWRKVMREDKTPREMIDLFQNEPADFAPGEKWHYDNSGYFLLGAILEKVTGKPYAEVLSELLFTPLGLPHTSYGADAPIVPGRVEGYLGVPGHYQNAPYLSMTQPYAAGALLSSVDDLARWAHALTSGTLVRKDLLDRMTTPYRLKTGKPTGYGYGLGLWSYEGHRVIEHGGAINGFETELLRMPDDHLLVVILSNNPNLQPEPSRLGLTIAAFLVGKPLGARKPVAVAPAVLDRYVGVYRIDEKTVRVVTREGDRLYTQLLPGGSRVAALPASETDFYYPDSEDRLRFQVDAAGKVKGMVMEQTYAGPIEAVRTNDPLPAERKAVTVAPEQLEGLVGSYRLGPGFGLAVIREGGRLFVQGTGQPRNEVFAASPDEYFLKDMDATLTFHRGPDGRATEVVLHQGGRDFPGPRER